MIFFARLCGEAPERIYLYWKYELELEKDGPGANNETEKNVVFAVCISECEKREET